MRTSTLKNFARFLTKAAAAGAIASLAGCIMVQPPGYTHYGQVPATYSHGETGSELLVRYGTVRNVRTVAVSQEQSGVGIVGGAVLGGMLGNKVGKGNGRKAATIIGALAGGAAGATAEANMRTTYQDELVIQLDSGNEITVVQPQSQYLRPGDRVRLTGRGDRVHVSR